MTYCPARAALGATDAISQRALQMQSALQAFNQQWRAAHLTDQAVPPGFVVDVLDRLIATVISPFTQLKMDMRSQVSNIFSGTEIEAAGRAIDVYWAQRLLPVMLEAIKQRNAGAKTMRVVIPGARTADQGLSWHISRIIIEVIDGYEQLMRVNAAKPWFLRLGGLTDSVLGYFVFAGKAVGEAKKVLAAAGDVLYAPVDAAKKLIDLTVKATVVGVIGYVIWKRRRKA